MELIGAVVVFLLSSMVGLLLALNLRVARLVNELATLGAGAAERAEVDAEQADAREQERRDHLDATAAIMLEHARLVGAGLAAEMREQSAQHRNDLRLAVGLPAVDVPAARRGRRASSPAAGPQLCQTGPASTTPAAGTRAASRGTQAAPGAWTVGDDEPTPPSGWTLDDVRERTQPGAEHGP